MVNQTDHTTARDSRKFKSKSAASKNPGKYQSVALDDVIASLANAPENRRAQQVTEWEHLRKNDIRIWA
ncbi:MAG: hypothetical protein WBO10_15125 [Pyrinomonadaceae bacterium]